MKAGLEIHQQLSTGKLFCACPAELSETISARATRRLRATGGENHSVDRAAAFQASRGLEFHYEATPSSCLVELDEEPPHALSPAALDVALTVALLLNARPVDEIEVMRKIVVDGSATSGFQRTALVATDGAFEVDGRRISILSICLEEDAARKIGESEGSVTYRLDRLGIPLVEIATGPEIRSGEEARRVAEELGALLRSTGEVRRGIGSIREDLNVSTEGGARIEIKGVQELRLIHRYVEGEEGRQRVLLETRERLTRQGARPPEGALVDVTALVAPVASGALAEPLRRGGIARALALPGFAGTLAPPGGGPERLGRELADAARSVGLRGLLHSDELPSAGLGAGEVDALRAATGATGPQDAFVLVAAKDLRVADRALERVRERARAALEGVPAETRDPLPDGRTRYSRPLPGRDRMYPETDVPPVPVTAERLERLRAELPEPPAAARRRVAERLGLPEEVVRQLQSVGELDLLEELVASGIPAGLVARVLTQELPAVRAERPAAEEIPHERLRETLAGVVSGRFSKEGVAPVLRAFADGAPSLDEAIQRAGLGSESAGDLDALARALVQRNQSLVAARGEAAFAPLMGDLMKELRGKRDGREIAEALRRALAERPGAGR